MWESLQKLLSSDFMPHGHCYLWRPGMVWLQVLSNGAIGIAYLAISLALAILVRRVRNLPFQWVYLAFGLFIVSCGVTHFMDIWVIWTPTYWLDGAIRALTAVASVGTAILLLPLLPKVRALTDAAQASRERGVRFEELYAELSVLYEGTRDAIAEAVPQLVWTSTPEGQVDYLNGRWTDYAGPGAYLGDGWQGVVHPDDLGPLLAGWSGSLASGVMYAMECRLRRADGAYHWFLSQALPLRDKSGQILKWFGTCTDIHDRKLAFEERERLLRSTQETVRARDVFLAVAAHELKTPMTPLRFETESLLRATTSGQAMRLSTERLNAKLSIIERQIGRLERLIGSLLDVSRIASGQLDVHLEEVDLGEVARDVAERHRRDLEGAGCALSLSIEEGVIGRWDRLRIEQIVTNLLTNAARYGAHGPVSVEVRADAERARLVVRDEGIGIASEDQRRIFEPFERAASERHYGGLGLGLWIVRRVVEALGGSVKVESAPGEGSRFTVELERRPRDSGGSSDDARGEKR